MKAAQVDHFSDRKPVIPTKCSDVKMRCDHVCMSFTFRYRKKNEIRT